MDEPTRRRLEQLRDFLKTNTLFEEDIAGWGAAALTRYLDGARSLDHAFGLKVAARRPLETERRFQLAIKVERLRNEGKSWKQIADQFDTDSESITDEKTIRSLQKEFEVQLSSHALHMRLSERDKLQRGK